MATIRSLNFISAHARSLAGRRRMCRGYSIGISLILIGKLKGAADAIIRLLGGAEQSTYKYFAKVVDSQITRLYSSFPLQHATNNSPLLGASNVDSGKPAESHRSQHRSTGSKHEA